MTDHREQIGDLLRAQLEADGELDPTDLVTHWTCLVGTHGADDDGDAPGATVVRSQRGMAITTELGLIEERRMFIQAVITDAHRRTRDDDDD